MSPLMNSSSSKGDRLSSPGRPKSIPHELFETILQLYAQGYGYRSITRHLRGLGLGTTHTTVRRLLKGEGAYAKCRVSLG